jgi:glycosyltransferase involved in cell wall biosynthesis
MHIGISTSVVHRGKTGIAQYVFALLRACLDLGGSHRYTLFVLEDDLPLFGFAGNTMRLVPVAEKNRPAVGNILWHQTELPRLARQHQLDVLHVPSYRRMLFPKPCPLVATIHDLAPFHIARKYDWTRMLYGRVVARLLARRQDQVIATSENTAADIRCFFDVSPERLTVIHNGLEHDRFFPGSPADAKTIAIQRHQLSRPFFLYVARLEHPGKNHVRLISGFNRFKSSTGSAWQLVFGGGDWHGAELIHAAIGRSPFSSDIRVLGFVPDQELPDLYRAADAFIYPSLFEGFGMPPIEAMACGCPVICSTRGSLGEVVGDAAAIVDPEDEISMADQMTAFSAGSELRSKFRVAGLVQAARFDWDRTAAETLKVYERAARGLKFANAKRFRPAHALDGNTDGTRRC